MRASIVALSLLLVAGIAVAEESYNEIIAIFEKIKNGIDSGSIEPERDIAPAIRLLKTLKDQDNRARVADKLADLGDADGDSPAAVKRYVVEQATPVLIEIAENKKNSTRLRSDAIHALRDLRPSKAVLSRIAEMALKDSDSFIQSRGEILQNYVASMEEDKAITPKDATKEREAIAFLKSRKVGVSHDQMMRSAIESKADEILALLDAGVDPNAGQPGSRPIDNALSACAHDGGENDAILATLDALIKGGADLKARDGNQNTPLISAAQYCGARVVNLLVAAGAEVNIVNGSTITPLMMALIMDHLDAAEALVAKGARLTAQQAQIAGTKDDPRVKAIVKKAMAKK